MIDCRIVMANTLWLITPFVWMMCATMKYVSISIVIVHLKLRAERVGRITSIGL